MSDTLGVHIWSTCHHCSTSPIVGPGYRCKTCPLGPDIDLCAQCYERYRAGDPIHPTDHRFERIEGHASEKARSCPGGTPRIEAPPLVAPSGFLIRPEFRSVAGSSFGSYGFVIEWRQHHMMLTALHVMDELMKSTRIDATASNLDYMGTELPALVRSVRLYDVLKKQWMLHPLGNAGPMLVLANARTGDPEPNAARDIAAFQVPVTARLQPGALASKSPAPGETLWLAARMIDGTRTRCAVCVEVTPETLMFRYLESKLMPKYTSGAPILNRHGEVVGINTGLGRIDGYEIGHANPLASIRTHLSGVREVN